MLFRAALLLSLTLFLAVHALSDEHGNDHGEHVSRAAHEMVKGRAFDRFVSIWLENTNFEDALADPNMQALAAKGITLTNYFALTHPSEPNYVASVGGEYFGIDSDDLFDIPTNVSTVVDLLEDKGITWGEYQEGLPFTGFQGFTSPNPQTGASDYARKHNPLIIFDSVTSVPERLENIKNFTLFRSDLGADALPQWSFMTPNMTNDGHDTNMTFAGTWSRGFIEPLLEDQRFNKDRTLVMLSFDENDSIRANRVFTLLLGSAIPKELMGTTDVNFYDHYSSLATVEANWDLHTLGRWDVGSNVFAFVAEQTGDVVRKPIIPRPIVLNLSYPGIFSGRKLAKQPVPNTRLVVNGRTVLPSIRKEWESQVHCTGYFGQLIPPSGFLPPPIPKGC